MTISAIDSPLGPLIAAATADALCRLEFSEPAQVQQRVEILQARYAQSSSASGTGQAGAGKLAQLRVQLREYFDGVRREFTVPLAYAGTPFQEHVWALLQQIRYGESWSYLELALRAGDRRATRAVGGANGANPIAIVIPCHRVVNANGELGGYSGGLWRKRILLDLEQGQRSLGF